MKKLIMNFFTHIDKNFILALVVLLVSTTACVSPGTVIDKTKLLSGADEVCSRVISKGTPNYDDCIRKTQLFASNICKKARTSVQFCNNYGVQPHPLAPMGEPSPPEEKLLDDSVKERIGEYCENNVSDGGNYSQCYMEKLKMYKKYCTIPVTDITDEQKLFCSSIKQ